MEKISTRQESFYSFRVGLYITFQMKVQTCSRFQSLELFETLFAIRQTD